MVNINDVAKMAGVSKSTVSNVMNGKKNVSEPVKEKVLSIANELGYFPNKVASALTTKKTGLTGLFIDNNRAFRQMDFQLMESVSLNLRQFNKHMVLYLRSGDNQIQSTEDINNKLIAEPIDEAIIVAPMIKDIRINELVQRHKPIVVIGQVPSSIKHEVKSLDIDNVQLTYDVTKHLLEKGHRHIAFLNSDSNMTISIDRTKGYIKALKEYKIDFNPEYFYNTDNSEEMGRELGERVCTIDSITAVITSSDIVASGLYTAIKSNGLSIPEDVSIFSLGGTDKDLLPALSTVYVDYRSLGQEAVALLNDENKVANRVLDTYELQLRDSVTTID